MSSQNTNEQVKAGTGTTDDWPLSKILKCTLLPKPKGSPPMGKKEWVVRGAIASSIGVLLWIFVWSKPSIPACGDGDAIATLKKVVQQNVNNAIGSKIIHIDGDRVAIHEIETISKDKDVSRNTCAANVQWMLSPSVLEVVNKIRDESYDINTDEMSIVLSLVSGQIDENKAQTLTTELNDFYSKGGKGLYKDQAIRAAGLIRAAELTLPSVDNATVDLSKKKTEYIIRKNEDKTSGSYVVEAYINQPVINGLSTLELLGAAYELGKVRLASLPPNPQTPANAVATALTPATAPLPAPVPAATSSVAPVPFKPSFDCSKASNNIERMICADPTLSALDVELSKQYSRVLATATDQRQLKAQQVKWVQSVRLCTSSECVASAYRERIAQLSK